MTFGAEARAVEKSLQEQLLYFIFTLQTSPVGFSLKCVSGKFNDRGGQPHFCFCFLNRNWANEQNWELKKLQRSVYLSFLPCAGNKGIVPSRRTWGLASLEGSLATLVVSDLSSGAFPFLCLPYYTPQQYTPLPLHGAGVTDT